MTWQAIALRVLREYRDIYPDGVWTDVNAALAQYTLEKRHARMCEKRELRTLRRKRRRQARRLTIASTRPGELAGLEDALTK